MRVAARLSDHLTIGPSTERSPAESGRSRAERRCPTSNIALTTLADTKARLALCPLSLPAESTTAKEVTPRRPRRYLRVAANALRVGTTGPALAAAPDATGSCVELVVASASIAVPTARCPGVSARGGSDPLASGGGGAADDPEAVPCPATAKDIAITVMRSAPAHTMAPMATHRRAVVETHMGDHGTGRRGATC